MIQNDPKLKTALTYSVEIAIRLGLLVLMAMWCFDIVTPFSSIILWSIILAMAFAPLFNKLSQRIGGRPKAAAGILVAGCAVIFVIPSWLIFDSVIQGAQRLRPYLEANTFELPPPSEQVLDWPIVGDQLYTAWQEAFVSMESFVVNHEEQFIAAAKTIASGIVGIGGSFIMLFVSVILAAVILANAQSENFGRRFLRRLVGARGDEFAETIASTVRSVVKGVIGVAIIQSLLIGLGMVFAGVPYAGIWTLLTLVLAILQLPVIVVIVGVVLWMFSSMETLPAVLWTIYFLAAGLSDNILKPILLGKGAKVPMAVIFFGVIGGFIASGFIGLFTGAIVVSLGYILFMSWLKADEEGTYPESVHPNKN